jgi:methionyl aminopeptidase
LGYRGFPGALCVSVNQEVVHGIPSATRFIQEGDVVSIDCGVVYKDHFTDACRTVAVGEVDSRIRKLIKVTSESLNKGILAAGPGGTIGDISYAIQKHVERHRFNVSLDFIGHGIGRVLHGPPAVPNYGPPGVGEELKPGTCLAIEPVVFDGSIDTILQNDDWTVVSKNDNLSAHFEDTILITGEGPEILTR